MNKNLLKIILCIFFLLALDYGVGTCLKIIYYKPKSGKYFDQTYVIDSIKSNIIIIGSSKASHGYIAQLIEDSLKSSCYNAGREGQHFLSQYAVFKSITKRYHPKMIVWDYFRGLESDDMTYFDLSNLGPYYYSHPEIAEVIDLKSPYEKVKMFSKIYPYNSSLIYNLNKSLEFFKNSEKDKSVKGYIPLNIVWKEKLTSSIDEAEGKPDTNCINAFKAAIKLCKQNNIKLIMVISPHYGIYKTSLKSDIVAKQIAHQEKIPFLDLCNDSTVLSTSKNFAEPVHLNKRGSKIFTNQLISKIRPYLKDIKNLKLVFVSR